jgi:hypothetical protein
MQYLGLALYAEGPTDYYFLRPLLQRLCEDLCTRDAVGPVEVSEVLALNHPQDLGETSRSQRILAAAELSRGAWNLLFVHSDGAKDPRRARAEQVEPSLELLRDRCGHDGVGVAVVPIRETEAWAIADGEAIRRVFGTRLMDRELGLPEGRAVEELADPKAVLNAAFKATQPSGRRRKQGASPYLNTLGEQVSLACLRNLAAFATLEVELKVALNHLRILC